MIESESIYLKKVDNNSEKYKKKKQLFLFHNVNHVTKIFVKLYLQAFNC